MSTDTFQQCSYCGMIPPVWTEQETFLGRYYLTCRLCGYPRFDMTRDEARDSNLTLRTPEKGLPFHDFSEQLDELKAALRDEIFAPLETMMRRLQ